MPSDETQGLLRPNWAGCLESVSVGILSPQGKKKEGFGE